MTNLQEIIAQFKEQTGYTLTLNDGHLYYGGSLYLENCTGITSLPDNLTVGGYLDLRGTGITSLPDNLTVGGSLYLKNCTGITSLPDNLTVGGSLDLENCTGITSLPDNLTVGGYLDLRGRLPRPPRHWHYRYKQNQERGVACSTQANKCNSAGDQLIAVGLERKEIHQY